MSRQVGAARSRGPRMRVHIPYAEVQSARLYSTGLRRVHGQKTFHKKVNPVKEYKREADLLSRFRFPREVIKRIAADFGRSPFFEKVKDPTMEARNFCNAEWMVGFVSPKLLSP